MELDSGVLLEVLEEISHPPRDLDSNLGRELDHQMQLLPLINP